MPIRYENPLLKFRGYSGAKPHSAHSALDFIRAEAYIPFHDLLREIPSVEGVEAIAAEFSGR